MSYLWWGRGWTFAILSLAMMVASTGRAQEPDLELGEEIFDTCAPCHGPFGQGGGGGVYPRLAGMDAEFIMRQLELFKSRDRENIPMIPFTSERDLPEDDAEAVAAYIQSLRLKTHLPKADDSMDALTRLKQAKQVLNIPRHPGDAELGAGVYGELCARCHGERGEGTLRAPMIAGQHIRYLVKSTKDFVEGKRSHKTVDIFFKQRSRGESEGILTFLSLQDDLGPVERDD